MPRTCQAGWQTLNVLNQCNGWWNGVWIFMNVRFLLVLPAGNLTLFFFFLLLILPCIFTTNWLQRVQEMQNSIQQYLSLGTLPADWNCSCQGMNTVLWGNLRGIALWRFLFSPLGVIPIFKKIIPLPLLFGLRVLVCFPNSLNPQDICHFSQVFHDS